MKKRKIKDSINKKETNALFLKIQNLNNQNFIK